MNNAISHTPVFSVQNTPEQVLLKDLLVNVRKARSADAARVMSLTAASLMPSIRDHALYAVVQRVVDVKTDNEVKASTFVGKTKSLLWSKAGAFAGVAAMASALSLYSAQQAHIRAWSMAHRASASVPVKLTARLLERLDLTEDAHGKKEVILQPEQDATSREFLRKMVTFGGEDLNLARLHAWVQVADQQNKAARTLMSVPPNEPLLVAAVHNYVDAENAKLDTVLHVTRFSPEI